MCGSADADRALVDVGAGYALGLLIGRAHRLGRGRKLRNQSLAHSRRLRHAVAAIAQHVLVHIGRQNARPCAADIEHHDQVVLLLAHGRSPTLRDGRG